jgi:hypothetical protein
MDQQSGWSRKSMFMRHFGALICAAVALGAVGCQSAGSSLAKVAASQLPKSDSSQDSIPDMKLVPAIAEELAQKIWRRGQGPGAV